MTRRLILIGIAFDTLTFVLGAILATTLGLAAALASAFAALLVSLALVGRLGPPSGGPDDLPR